MIAVDTNLLVYAHRRDSQWHARAAEVVRQLAEGPASWAIPSPCLHEFLAIATHEKIFAPPTPLPKALDQIAAWLESPTLVLLTETDGYWKTFARTAVEAKIAGSRVHDARVAALCIHHGVRLLLTTDREYSRFGGLPTRNPLPGR